MKTFNKGLLFGTLSGMTWGMNTVTIGVILLGTIFLPYSANLFITALVVAFLHDFCSALWMLLNLVRNKKIGELFQVFKTKVGYLLLLGSVLGGPVGMAGYLLGVKYLGPSYTASFSALYPALGTVLSALFLKEHVNGRMKIGVVVSGIGIFLLSYAPIDLEMYPHYLLGTFFAFFCVFGWSLECVIASYAMRYGEVDSSVAMCLRQMTSACFYGLVTIPFIHGYPLVQEIFKSPTILFIAATAFVGSLSYLFWYASIDLIGAPRGMSLNITYVIWTIIFEKLYFHTILSPRFILASIIIVLGIVLLAGNPKEMLHKENV